MSTIEGFIYKCTSCGRSFVSEKERKSCKFCKKRTLVVNSTESQPQVNTKSKGKMKFICEGHEEDILIDQKIKRNNVPRNMRPKTPQGVTNCTNCNAEFSWIGLKPSRCDRCCGG